MAVKLRLKRFGRLNHPTYRVCATESRFPRDGRIIETVGFYLPKARGKEQLFDLNDERIRYWLSVGAQPSDTVASLIVRKGIEMPRRAAKDGATSKARRKSRAGKSQKAEWTPPKRLGKGRLAKKKWRAKHAPVAAATPSAAASEDAGDE